MEGTEGRSGGRNTAAERVLGGSDRLSMWPKEVRVLGLVPAQTLGASIQQPKKRGLGLNFSLRLSRLHQSLGDWHFRLLLYCLPVLSNENARGSDAITGKALNLL